MQCSENLCPRVFEVWDAIGERGYIAVQSYLFAPGQVPPLVEVPDGREQIGWMTRAELLSFAASVAGRREPESFADLLKGFDSELFRLETRAEYLVPAEAERLAAYRAGHHQPPPSESMREYGRQVASDATAGRRRRRVHVVNRPLSLYLRWELEAYRYNVDAGEEVLIADRYGHSELDALREDFYLLDGDGARPLAVLVHYDDAGRPLAGWRTDDPETIDPCRRMRDLALAAAVPLEAYLASLAAPEPTAARGT